jgi:hypothetical protein
MINHKPTEVAPKLWVEVVVFFTAYYPLFLILLIRDIDKAPSGPSFWFVKYGYQVSWWALSLFFLSSVASLFSAHLMRKNLTYQQGGLAINVLSCRLIRGDMLNYTLPFLIGLFAFGYGTWQSIAALLMFLLFMFAFVSKDRVILLNPMFLLIGIRLYEIKYSEVGNTVEKTKTVLCLGELKESKTIIYTKESAGIEFVYPEKVAEGTQK